MSLKKYLFTLLFMASFLFSGLNSAIEIDPSNLFIPTSLDGVRLLHDENGFTIEKDGDRFLVKAECMDKELRSLSDEGLDFLLGLKAKIEIDGEEQVITRIPLDLTRKLIAESQDLVQFSPEDSEKIISQLPASSYIKVFQYSDGEYGLHLQARLLGGGGFGAFLGAITGKFIVHALGGVVAGLAGLGATLVAGPVAGWAVAAGTWGVIAPTVEVTSTVVALATGIAAGVATGPV